MAKIKAVVVDIIKEEEVGGVEGEGAGAAAEAL